MGDTLRGNKRGLSPSQIRSAERLFHRKLADTEIVSLEFAREIYEVAVALGRMVGVLVNREGRVEEVFLGERTILYMPNLGRYRLGAGRLRRLRLIYSDLSKAERPPVITNDIYTDLEKLRFDAVCAVKTYRGQPAMTYAYNFPQKRSEDEPVATEQVGDLGRFSLNFQEFIQGIEQEFIEVSKKRKRKQGASAILVGVYDGRGVDPKRSMAELKELARTAGVDVVDTVIQRRRSIDPKTLMGKGKLEEVVLQCLRLEADMLIFDRELQPAQWRIITNSTDLKILDRSMIILDIFAQRASSSDGRLQVELAQLKYNLPRLVEKDAGLSRLTGGIGGRGPGETKLEIGRRRIRDRISMLDKKIGKLEGQRGLRRQRRQNQGIPLVAILGYTNVGKSTLFNALTKSDVISENKLFATLDPAQRRITLPMGDPENPTYNTLVLSDTVGFIRDLPDELKNAFRATLEELYDASLFVHVLDASEENISEQKSSVENVLREMELLDLPSIVVINKTDLVSEERVEELVREFDALPVSAVEREGFENLIHEITKRVFKPKAEIAQTAQP